MFAAVQIYSSFRNLKFFPRGGGAHFFKIKLNLEFFLIYILQLHGEQLSILHSQLLTRLLYYMSPNMVYARIIGSRQIGNYLAGHVPPNRKLFGGTVPPNRKLFGRTVPPNSLPLY